MKKARSGRPDLRGDPLAVAHSQTMRAFEDMLVSRLKPVLGAAGVRRIQTEAAIATSIGGGVIVHAPLRRNGRVTAESLAREPIVAVLATTITLVDPVTYKGLEPGAYAVGVRPIGRKAAAFDFYGTRGAPTFSKSATAKDAGTDAGGEDSILDVDIIWGGPDSLVPPGEAHVCLSLFIWAGCWFVEWPPRLPWPF